MFLQKVILCVGKVVRGLLGLIYPVTNQTINGHATTNQSRSSATLHEHMESIHIIIPKC